MADVTIRIYFRDENGKIEDAELDYELSEFGGHLPAVGDNEDYIALVVEKKTPTHDEHAFL